MVPARTFVQMGLTLTSSGRRRGTVPHVRKYRDAEQALLRLILRCGALVVLLNAIRREVWAPIDGQLTDRSDCDRLRAAAEKCGRPDRGYSGEHPSVAARSGAGS